MLLSVRHTTTYAFETPMRFIAQSHRLHPVDNAAQKIRDWSVTAEGAVFGASFTDGAGDRVTTMTAQGPVETLSIVVKGTVETFDTTGVLREHREIISPLVYLEPTAATAPIGALLELITTTLERAKGTELARAHFFCGAVSEAIAYEPGTTGAHTTAAEAVEQGRGVCQDHAQALVALARAANMPARYVSGYLMSRGDGGDEEASHAWAEIWVPGLNWVGFDAANDCCPDDRYIRLGSGRDAREAAPIRGVSRGGGTEALDVSVTVAAREQQ